MKRIMLVLVVLLFVTPLKAQNYEDYKNKKKEQVKRYTDSIKQSYDEFRRKANEEYAQFMREKWEAFQVMRGEEKPFIPEPPKPYEVDKDTPVPNLPNPIPIKPIPTPDPIPTQPVKRPDVPLPSPVPSTPDFEFSFYGTPCTVCLDKSLKFKLKNVSEIACADAWQKLSSKKSDALLEDCLDLREELALGDWAYYCLIRDLTEAFLGKGTEEATMMHAYLMAQSGYRIRLGKRNERLVFLMQFDGKIFGKCYAKIGGEKFYIMGANEKEGGISVFNRAFSDRERIMSLRMQNQPGLDNQPTESRQYTSVRYPEMTVSVSTNKNLMDFYNDYPSCLWTNYCWAGLSEELKNQLYPMLRRSIEGRSQIEAANRIINFVQTAFSYKTDQEQFGYERSLFGDETFFYPYSDCEDRSILFSILIHDLLGLDVVLLSYPDHIATAVHYTEELRGSYFTFEGKTYFISDPTYIGADVGMCASKFINLSPEVYKLYSLNH